MARCIAVDFDGTLVRYDGFKGVGIYGEPIPAMVDRVRAWLANGDEVVIFTARAFPDEEGMVEIVGISTWLADAGLPQLQITCMKLKKFTEIWDDRAIRVERNKGDICFSR